MKKNPLMPRVVLVTHFFSTHRGGVEIVAAQLASMLAKEEQFTIEWFASDCDPAPVLPPGVRPYPVRTWNGLSRLGLDWPVWGLRGFLALRRAVATADIVHLHDFSYCGNIAAFVFAKWYRKPVVITQHVGDVPYRNSLLTAAVKMLNGTLGCFMLARADRVVFVSDAVRRLFSGFTRFKTPPEFWPNGVDSGAFHPCSSQERAALRARLGVDDARPVLLFAGRFVERKGLRLLRAMAAAYPQAAWWFAGRGDASSPLHPGGWGLENVQVFEDRSGASLADLYRAADLLVLPSCGEGFPLVVQEAMACGTPVFISPETAEGAPSAAAWLHHCALEPEENAVGRWLAEIRDILQDDTPARRDGLAAFAKTEWSWEVCAAQYAELFRNIVTPQPTGYK